MHKLRIASLLVLALACLTATFSVHAADTAVKTSEASGTFVGTPGGTHVTWNVTLPANTDVTLSLAHWPCQTGAAISLNVWGPMGLIAKGTESEACVQKAWFNTGNGGMAEVQASSYLDGVGVWYTLTATGVELPGAMAPAAKPAEPMAPAATTKEMAPAAAVTTTTVAAPAAKPAMPAATTAMAKPASNTTLGMYNQSLVGSSGGTLANHNLMVKEGQTYTIRMSWVAPDNGGTWPGVGFNVWGPTNDWIAASHSSGDNWAEATFKASGDVMYLIQPYNYHPGIGVLYNIETVETN